MADLAKAEKLAAAKLRVEKMKKKINANKEAGSDSVNLNHTSSSGDNLSASSLKLSSQVDSTEEAKHINDKSATQERSTEDVKFEPVVPIEPKSNKLSLKELSTSVCSEEPNPGLSCSTDPTPKGVKTPVPENVQPKSQFSPSDCLQSEPITLATNCSDTVDTRSSIKKSSKTSVPNLDQNTDEITDDVSVVKSVTAQNHIYSSNEFFPLSDGEKDELQRNAIETASSFELETQLQILREECERQKAHSIELQQRADKFEKECIDLRVQLTNFEKENHCLQHELNVMRIAQGNDSRNQGLDQFDTGKDFKMIKKIQDLEEEISELRKSVNNDHNYRPNHGVVSIYTSPTSKFTEVDLDTHSSPRRETFQNSRGRLGNLLSSGLHAITGSNTGIGDEAFSLNDELMDFDEDAFRQAQEKQASDHVERVKDIKRKLKNWEGWRLDLVEDRNLVEDHTGPIFDI